MKPTKQPVVYLSVQQYAFKHNVSRQAVHKKINHNLIPGVKRKEFFGKIVVMIPENAPYLSGKKGRPEGSLNRPQ
jgi:hypothetical protein